MNEVESFHSSSHKDAFNCEMFIVLHITQHTAALWYDCKEIF